MALHGGKLLEWLQDFHHVDGGPPHLFIQEESPVGVRSSLLSLEQLGLARCQVIDDRQAAIEC